MSLAVRVWLSIRLTVAALRPRHAPTAPAPVHPGRVGAHAARPVARLNEGELVLATEDFAGGRRERIPEQVLRAIAASHTSFAQIKAAIGTDPTRALRALGAVSANGARLLRGLERKAIESGLPLADDLVYALCAREEVSHRPEAR